MNDPLCTRELREAALAAWAAHPARLREDANCEEDHARGYYRNRVVVELAQNAADAAARAGVVGRLLLRLECDGDRAFLIAANTGAPIDAAGVASLASLRASAKRDGGAVGRFGVGFAAVRSVADEVSVVSTSGAVHFSLAQTRELLGPYVGRDAALADEVSRRGDWLPVLRLPLPGTAEGHDGRAPSGWDTVVVLTLRDADAVVRIREQLAVDDALLLALPALGEVVVDAGEPQVLAGVCERWLVARRSGILDPALLADRPVEEQERTGWQVAWAVRRDGPTPPGVVHAPTPTDEPCTLPALLIGTFPLDPSRRHVAPGPLTDALVVEAGRAWAELLVACRSDDGAPEPADLLPGGLPAGPLDAALHDVVLDATRTAPMLRTASGGVVAPVGALVLTDPVDREAARLLGRVWPALVEPAPRRLVRLLGLETTDLAELVEGMPTMGPADARALYDAFAGADPTTLEHLGTVAVPLADGRIVHGARGLVMLDDDPVLYDDAAAAAITALAGRGLRVVHPDAAHPLLERLGAQRLGITALLRSESVRVMVADEADLLLPLVAAAVRRGPVEPETWWGEVLLPAADGEQLPARGLVLGGSRAQECFDPAVLPAVSPQVQEWWGAAALAAVGVRTDLLVLRVPADLADGVAESLDGWEAYREEVGLDAEGPEEVLVVPDLDAVLPRAWPRVVAELAHTLRRALEPLLGRAGADPSYATWWLRHRAGIGLDRPFALPGGPRFLRPAPAVVAGIDLVVQRWLGGVRTAADLTTAGWAVLVTELEEGAQVELAVAVGLWRALVDAAGDAGPLADAAFLPALVSVSPGVVRAVPADDVAVASPMWAQLPDCLPALVVPADLVGVVADAMDLDRADERAAGRVTSTGDLAVTPDAVRAVFEVPDTWMEHDDLRVDRRPVDWWVDDRVHAATTAGLAQGLAASLGGQHAAQIEVLLGDPGAIDRVLFGLAGED